ncbi:type I secretion system permease/ATPase [Pelagerythrobacter marensis]|uniref:Putative ABC transporter permease/ATP-binding protein n=1 Tax=Pelagerythrobacter marensis TaxID=543877 RepID=A0A0G3XBI8_9SPHN|nr:type I secretion system permease/ATPase [Pelagerythrobacter marensis]AKM07738.1 Putative ABC transporter permease/ATP-binding protein [Pelagerythrobacter marensis]
MTASLTHEGDFRPELWIEAFRHVARQYGLPVSAEGARLSDQWQGDQDGEARLRALARHSGLQVRLVEPAALSLSSWRLPLIARFGNGDLAVVTGIGDDGTANLAVIGEDGLQQRMALTDLVETSTVFIIPRPSGVVPDARVDTYIQPYRDHWLRQILLQDRRMYPGIVIASLVTNSLALAGVLFSMQVYDRVVPAESFATLYVLFIGVLVAIGFSFALTKLRTTMIDVLGRRADLRISDRVFGHALRVRNSDRPASTGTFIAQLRDLEQVRELLTSTTVAAIADIPFFLLFLGVFWFIAGPLALVPLCALLLLVIPGWLAQRKLRTHATEAMRESSLRNALLVESVQRIEDIKTLQAEEPLQRRWNHFNAVASEAQLRLRSLTNGLTAWAQNIQNTVYATIVFFGAPMVIAGDMTTGALVGASILGSRMMAPIGQVTQVLNRLQQAKVGVQGVDQIMALPVDTPEREQRLQVPAIEGDFDIRSAVFAYGDASAPPVLTVERLEIAAGEKIALLGRNGAGKSTLLQGLSGLLPPILGEVTVDDLALHQIDPADVRRDIGLLGQNSRLFHGTLRDNLTMGAPHASDREIADMLEMVGAADFVRGTQSGLDYSIQEGGTGLSGGQTQALLLARLLLRQPSVVLLDEPTASMDEATERHFIRHFGEWSKNRTVIIATHRMRALDLVDRIVVLHNGKVTLDQPKEAAMATMQGAANGKGQAA